MKLVYSKGLAARYYSLECCSSLTETVSSGKEALIVGTKKQAQSIITDISEETGMHYVNKRWLGGLLTNFSIVKKSIEKLLDLDEMKRDGRWEEVVENGSHKISCHGSQKEGRSKYASGTSGSQCHGC